MSSLTNKKIMITCGPTWVPIDDVRVISNISTGELGQTIARKCHERGADVTIVEGPVEQHLTDVGITVKRFKYYEELMQIIRKELVEEEKKYDAIFHAAAVSDYTIKNPHTTKMKSDADVITLNLIPLPKLIRSLRKLNPEALIIGFKLESDMDEVIAKNSTTKLFTESFCDLVVANTLKEQNYLGYVVDQESILATEKKRSDLAERLIDIVSEKI